MSKQPPKPSQILLWSLPRSGCHLLEKMVFSKQEGLKYCWHPHECAVLPLHKWLSSEDILDESNSNRKDYVTNSAAASETWRAALKEAQETNQTLYMHEHAIFAIAPSRTLEVVTSSGTTPRANSSLNFTTVPDDLLLHPGTIPLITIRNPILYVPSNYRAAGPLYSGATRHNWLNNTSLTGNRDLYDYFVAHGIEPIVADADDYMTSEAFVRHLTSKLSLDPEKAIVSWPKSTEQEKQDMHPMLLTMQTTLVNSEGIRPDRAAKNGGLEKEREKWKAEFSAEEVGLIEELVGIAMPEYEYLRERRLRL